MTAPSGYVLDPLREDADLPSMRISREQTAQGFDVEPRQVQMVSLASKTWAREPVPAKLGTPRLLLFCVVLFFFTLSPVDAHRVAYLQVAPTSWDHDRHDLSSPRAKIATITLLKSSVLTSGV